MPKIKVHRSVLTKKGYLKVCVFFFFVLEYYSKDRITYILNTIILYDSSLNSLDSLIYYPMWKTYAKQKF